MSEWLKEPASKTGVRVTVSGVRIPSPPQKSMQLLAQASSCFVYRGPRKFTFSAPGTQNSLSAFRPKGLHAMLCRAPAASGQGCRSEATKSRRGSKSARNLLSAAHYSSFTREKVTGTVPSPRKAFMLSVVAPGIWASLVNVQLLVS